MIYVRGRGGWGKGKGEKGRDAERGFIIIGAGMRGKGRGNFMVVAALTAVSNSV